MKEFKYIITAGPKVNPADVRAKLVELLDTEMDAFDAVSDQFIAANYAITPVPVEIAMTMPEREHLMKVSPKCEFVITGIPEESAVKLCKTYDYEIFCTPEKAEEKKDVEYKAVITVDGETHEITDPDKVKALAKVMDKDINAEINGFWESMEKFNKYFDKYFG